MAAIGAGIILLVAAWALANTGLDTTAKILALFFGFIVGAPLIGFGIAALNRGQAESLEERLIGRQRKLLNMVTTQGKVNISEVALEMDVTRDEARNVVRDLVGKQLFSGYIDWDQDVLYSVEAQKLKDNGKCPKCGGKLELAGKGLIKCPYCGTEVFLS
jgi:DNA-directed RNA polymerase subunit RPC12/RpoP